MKKTTGFTFFIIPAALVLSSCLNITNTTTSSTISAPAISASSSDKSITLTVTYPGSTSYTYYNVFRFEMSDSTSSATVVDNSLINLGQIVPNTDSGFSLKESLQFIDYYTDSTKYYEYYVRYAKSIGSYTFSEKSQTVAGNGANGEVSITNNSGATAVPVIYDSDGYTLSILSTNITLPSTISGDSFTPKLAVSNGSITRLFEITASGSYYTIALQNKLTSPFKDTSITVTGLVCETKSVTYATDANTTIRFTQYYWTSPADIAIENSSGTSISTITVPTDTSSDNQTDYGDTSASIAAATALSVNSDAGNNTADYSAAAYHPE